MVRVSLDRLFEGEHIPDDPTVYLDQRYIDYLAKNGEEMDAFTGETSSGSRRSSSRHRAMRLTWVREKGRGHRRESLDEQRFQSWSALMLIQCKRYKDVVGIETVKAFWSDVHFEGAESGLIATTSSVSRDSKKLCEYVNGR